ncbi:hypothetical protein MHI24_17755 [Paenibacillus sp. FSL K6-1096]
MDSVEIEKCSMLADWDALIWANRAILEATRTQMRLTTIFSFISGYLE